LRVKAKPAKGDYHEYLTYEFTERKPAQATVALAWEDLALPWTITVDNPTDLYIARIREELRNNNGFRWQNWVAAAQYALNAKRPNDALEFADRAVNFQFVGQENFQTLNTLASAQEAAGKPEESKATREKALNHPTASVFDLHAAGRQLIAQGKKDDALRIFELNAKRNPNAWPVNVGRMRRLLGRRPHKTRSNTRSSLWRRRRTI
jgi:tetratricopeptide (TPR) repeat protein